MPILHYDFKVHPVVSFFIQQKRNIILNIILLSLFSFPFYATAQVCPPATSAQVCPTNSADFNLMTPCYVNGSRAANPNDEAIVLWNHETARGISATKQVLASYAEVGTVWGMAWRAKTKKLYAAAFIKRHCDLSPDGLGAIYEIDLTTATTAGAGTPTLWMNLNSTTHLGAGASLFPSETAANRGLGAKTAPNHDIWAFNKVGKEGLGDIEISEDGNTLYAMDLTNRQVLAIDMTTKTVINRYPVNTPSNYPNADDRRPFAIKHYKNELYIGMVGSAESSQKKIDLRASVLKLSGSSFNTVFEIDSMGVADPADPTNVYKWTSYRGNPNFGTGLGWHPNFTTDIALNYDLNDPYNYIQYTVPLISDIEFDENGNMVIGIMDWAAHRYGSFNYIPNTANTTNLKSIQGHGDIIKATKSGTSWVKEPALGKHYNDMQAVLAQAGWPTDTYMGGMVIANCNGTDLLAANMQGGFNTSEGAVVWMKTSDGLMQTNTTSAPAQAGFPSAVTISEGSRLRIYWGNETSGKANGLGDMVGTFAAACIIPCPITLSTSAPTCSGATANNDGKITLTAITNADKYAISAGTTFNGSNYASATIIGTLPFDLKTNVPNAGETYTIRFYNGSDACYKDVQAVLVAKSCSCPNNNCFETTIEKL